MKIREWVIAYRVCKKYRLKFSPFISIGDGMYSWSDKKVYVNPFDPDFITTFLHEVGHHTHNSRVDYNTFMKAEKDELKYSSNDRSVYKTLDSEGIASRFAVKTGLADKELLLKCFTTYSAIVFEAMDKPYVVAEQSKIVDCVYKNIRRIEK